MQWPRRGHAALAPVTLMNLATVSVQCGSRPGIDPAFEGAARELGSALVSANLSVVYGGMATGLMGFLADSVLEQGGRIVGVIPRFLNKAGLRHEGLAELHVVKTMEERKSLMLDLADATIVLPGGVGTMDEFWEVLAGAQLEQHSKPCGLLNISGYYDSLLAFMDRALREGLISLSDKNNVIVGDNSKVLIERLFEAVAVTRLPALRDSRREERAKS